MDSQEVNDKSNSAARYGKNWPTGVENSKHNNVNLESKNTMYSDPSIADHGRKTPFGGGLKGLGFLFSRVDASNPAKPEWEERGDKPRFLTRPSVGLTY